MKVMKTRAIVYGGLFLLTLFLWGLVYAINTVNEGFNIVNNNIPVTINVHNICQEIRNQTSTWNIFVPTNTLAEWQSFLSANISWVFKSICPYITKIAIWNGWSCAMKSNWVTYCWGTNNTWQIGDGTITNRSIPTLVSWWHAFKVIALWNLNTCAIRTDNKAMCWGSFTSWQWWDGTTTNKSVPTLVSWGYDFKHISTNRETTCWVRTDNKAMCWGMNNRGQIWDNTTTQRNAPTLVLWWYDFREVSVWFHHVCWIRTDNKAMCWWWNWSGQIGDGTWGTNRSIPTLVSWWHDFKHISAWEWYTCGVRLDNVAMCWGTNEYGQLWDGTSWAAAYKTVPTIVSWGYAFTEISVWTALTCGLKTDNKAMCWWRNDYWQIWDGTTTHRIMPTLVSGWYDFSDVVSDWSYYNSSFPFHVCWVRLDWVAMCWWYNSSWQIWDGTTTNKSIPTIISGAHNFN